MRLFIAILFPMDVKLKLAELRDAIHDKAVHGTFTPTENLHMTLFFLGERDRNDVWRIKDAMDELKFDSFRLTFSSLGFFRRNDGNLWFSGIEKSTGLERVYDELGKKLYKIFPDLERRKLKAHVTLSRRTLSEMAGFSFKPFTAEVDSIDLMLSERTERGMKYTSLYSVKSSDFMED